VFDDLGVCTNPFGYVVRTFCNVLVDGDAEYGVLVRSGEGVLKSLQLRHCFLEGCICCACGVMVVKVVAPVYP
jgi:hypothetical protein